MPPLLLSSSQYLSLRNIEEFQVVKFSDVLSPKYLQDENSECLWKSPVDGLINIKFQHTSPKSNRLYLYFPQNDKIKIRMEVINGGFRGTVFANKGECIDIRWKKS